ncbi:MAG: LptF/LptG family permease [Candidatus Omnitrophica bacterium]|nr:LptF/LptG family permease [Candidatus Omnitrophota bacterium]
MRIIRNYILSEFIGPLVLSMLLLSFVFTVGHLVQIAYLVINKGVDTFTVMKLFLLRIPAIFTYILPISVLVAVLISLGRLSYDNEIIAMRASGIAPIRIVAPLLVLGIILSMAMTIINDRLIPYAHFQWRKTLIEVGIRNPAAALEPGVFITSFERYILFIYAIDGERLYNIRIYEPQGENKPTRVIVARQGEFLALPEQKIIKLKLIDGTADEPDPEHPSNFYKLNFKTYFMTLQLGQLSDPNKLEKKPKDMTVSELKKEIIKLKQAEVDTTPLLVEIHKKIALGFAPFIFVLLGAPLSMITRRREKSLNFGIAFIIIGIYYLLLLGAEALAIQGYLQPLIALWLPNLVLGFLGSYLFVRLCVS